MSGDGFTMEDFQAHVQRVSRMVGETFTEPDSDWVPALHLWKEGRGANVKMVGGDTKEQFVRNIARAIVRYKADMASLLTSAWMLRLKVSEERFDPANPPQTYADLGIVPPGEHPDRIEVLNLATLTAERGLFSMAQIIRREGKPPVLGPWERSAEHATGQFVDPLREALLAVKEM